MLTIEDRVTNLNKAYTTLNTLTKTASKSEIKKVAGIVHGIAKDEKNSIVFSDNEPHIIPCKLLNVIESTYALKSCSSWKERKMKLWVMYAKENLVEYINQLEKERL